MLELTGTGLAWLSPASLRVEFPLADDAFDTGFSEPSSTGGLSFNPSIQPMSRPASFLGLPSFAFPSEPLATGFGFAAVEAAVAVRLSPLPWLSMASDGLPPFLPNPNQLFLLAAAASLAGSFGLALARVVLLGIGDSAEVIPLDDSALLVEGFDEGDLIDA